MFTKYIRLVRAKKCPFQLALALIITVVLCAFIYHIKSIAQPKYITERKLETIPKPRAVSARSKSVSNSATTTERRTPMPISDRRETASNSASSTATTKSLPSKEISTQEVSTSPSKSQVASAKPRLPFDPNVWKFQPPKSALSTVHAGTVYPDSLNPKRNYNTEPPNLPECRHNENVFSIYMATRMNCDYIEQLSGIYPGKKMTCNLPKGISCEVQTNEALADAVFKFVYMIRPQAPLRYCRDQVLIVFISEAIRANGPTWQQLDLADIRVDYLRTSHLQWNYICTEFPEIYHGIPADSYDPKIRTKGVALFSSDCKVDEFRYNYYVKILQYIKLDSFGKCFHNVNITVEPRYEQQNFLEFVIKTLKSYRMMFTFENFIQQDYISEKIWLAYSGGAIPVYLGPPDIYDWVPGNHTFINARNFAGPKELAEYMQLVAEDDELYRYHTTNFDWDRTRRMMDKNCPKVLTFCRMCEMAYEKRNNATLPK